MNDLLEYLQKLWQAAGYPGIAALFALLAGTGSGIWQLGTKLWKSYQQRKLQRDLFPFYSDQEIRRATQYYVETKCQNVAPSKEHEPGKSRLFVAKEKVLPFFLKNAFKSGQDEYQFYIVLADSGMGKTTFLINLYLNYTNQFLKPAYSIKLFPLGDSRTDQEIEKLSIEDKRRTILLLDAFDEDIQAVADHKTRLDALINKTQDFREVVLTCRTQFFPREEEEPKETGILKFGVEKGYREFYKLYLSPFDDRDIRSYLRKRFPWYQWTKRQKAHQIVKYSPNLMVRPMLLSYIGELLESQRNYTAMYMLYEELIKKWIEREVSRIPLKQREQHKQELYKFSREVALNIYRQREQRQGMLVIPGDEIALFATKHQINLDEIVMKSRSLLNRNTQGQYKFSHKSILEYFLALEAFSSKEFREEIQDFKGMDQVQTFLDEMVWEKLTVPFFSRGDLSGEYNVKDGSLRVLTKLPEKILAEITTLKLQELKASDDALLFRGLPCLKCLVIETQLTEPRREELHYALPECQICKVLLRNTPLNVSEKEFQKIFGLNSSQRPLKYIQNEYEDQGEVVVDHATGLMWQKAGSEKELFHKNVQQYVQQLNNEGFAGHNDWRLPTISELMSLLEPEKQLNDLYIKPIFNSKQRWCWSSDEVHGSSGAAWGVRFPFGSVYWNDVEDDYYVRCVRS